MKSTKYKLALSLVVCMTLCLGFNSISEGVEYTYTELLPPGWIWSGALAINDSGAVVGDGDDGTTYKGFLYSDGVYTDIMPPGRIEAYAIDINNRGEVVGSGYDGTDTQKGFLYSEGVYTDIIPPGWESANAHSINDSGAVVGGGSDGSFIATPIATPIEQIHAIIDFFDNGVAGGNLSGIGKTEQAAAGKLKAFRNMLVQAQYLIENENNEEACGLLMATYKKVDGTSRPPDFIGGSAAHDLAAKIDALIGDLNCL